MRAFIRGPSRRQRRRLSHRGLTELSREAVKVDRHARVVAPAVFGRSAPAGRGL